MPKIGFDQIVDSENIRRDYADIEELADSIKKRGQLEPVIVKKADPAEDGTPRYELVAGFRRLRAVQLLHKAGDAQPEIDAVVKTGDRLTLQLIENLQRSDLTSREREEGIYKMTQQGLSQKEVAAELSKRPDYISRHITAYKIRQIAEEANIDTADMETSALTEMASVKKEDIPMILGYIKNGGGTKEAARKIIGAYRGNKAPPPAPEQAPPEPPAATEPPPDDEKSDFEKANRDHPVSETHTLPGTGDMDPLAGIEPAPEAPPKPKEKDPYEEPDEPDHRVVDFQFVLDVLYSYQTALKKKIEGCDSIEAAEAGIKNMAILDIIALLHEKL
jgi:ParB/RepB/Spo0J family partition protein